MEQHNAKTNDMLAAVVEKFQLHRQKAMEHKGSIVGETARGLCDIDVYEMYLLSQEGYWCCEG